MKLKKFTALILATLMLLGFAGCVLNEEKDATAVVATVNGVEYTKGQFNDFYNFHLFRQEVYGSPITGTKEQMTEYKASMFDEYVLRLVLREECEAAGVSADTATIDSSVTELITKLGELPSKAEVLRKYGIDEATIKEKATEMITLLDYISPFLSNNLDNSFGERIVLTVGETKLPISTFYYYVIANCLMQAVQGQNNDPFDTVNFYPTIYKYLAAGEKSIQYVKDNNLTIPEETENEMRDSIAMLDLYGLSDYAKNVFFLTDSQINDAVEFTVMALSSQEVILNKYGEDAEFTEEELKAYYNSSSSKYNASYVKAYHILTEDKAFAEEMLKETGNTADGFMAVFEKYEKDERVTQAIDLGKFGYGQMVAEFEECAFALKEGEVGICDTEFGTHLVYVYESNITDTTYEDVKDQVLADYTADFIQYFGQSHLDEMISTYEDVAGDYDIIPADLLTEYLYNKYSVKVDKKVGSR